MLDKQFPAQDHSPPHFIPVPDELATCFSSLFSLPSAFAMNLSGNSAWDTHQFALWSTTHSADNCSDLRYRLFLSHVLTILASRESKHDFWDCWILVSTCWYMAIWFLQQSTQYLGTVCFNDRPSCSGYQRMATCQCPEKHVQAIPTRYTLVRHLPGTRQQLPTTSQLCHVADWTNGVGILEYLTLFSNSLDASRLFSLLEQTSCSLIISFSRSFPRCICCSKPSLCSFLVWTRVVCISQAHLSSSLNCWA